MGSSSDDYFCRSTEESTELTGGARVGGIIFGTLFLISLSWICCVCYIHHSEVTWDECYGGCSCCPPRNGKLSPAVEWSAKDESTAHPVTAQSMSDRDEEKQEDPENGTQTPSNQDQGFFTWLLGREEVTQKAESSPEQNEDTTAANRLESTSTVENEHEDMVANPTYMACGDSCVVS